VKKLEMGKRLRDGRRRVAVCDPSRASLSAPTAHHRRHVRLVDDPLQRLSVIQASDAFAYEESVVSSREEFQRKIRIACQAFNVHRLVWPHLRNWMESRSTSTFRTN